MENSNLASQKILLCDDHSFFRTGMTMALHETSPQFEVIQAESGERTLEMLEFLKPVLVVIDLTLPGMSGLSLIEKIKDTRSDLPLLVMTGCQNALTLRRVRDLGVCGIVQKTSENQEVLAVLNRLLESPGEEPCLDEKTKQILGENPEVALTSREYEVLQLIVQGFSNKEIADRLDCAVTTIRFHRSNIMQKANVHSAAEMTAWFLQGKRKDNSGPLA